VCIMLHWHISKNLRVISVTGRGGLQGCAMLSTQHCLDNRLTDGGEVVSLHADLAVLPINIFISVSGTE
jgi:hypothetical protein